MSSLPSCNPTLALNRRTLSTDPRQQPAKTLALHQLAFPVLLKPGAIAVSF
jgi:hypothetical protein